MVNTLANSSMVPTAPGAASVHPTSEPADPAAKAISSDRRLTPSSRPVSQATSTVTGNICSHISMKSPTGDQGVIIACTWVIVGTPFPVGCETTMGGRSKATVLVAPALGI